MSQTKQLSSLKNRLSLYSVAAGAGALAGGAAFAAPVDTGISLTISVGPGGFEDAFVDVNDDGNDNFRITVSNDSFGYCGAIRFSGERAGDQVLEDTEIDDFESYAALIDEGDSVGPDGEFATFSTLFGDCYSPDGNFAPGTRGFIGFQIQAGIMLAGGTPPQGMDPDVHYGYADVEVTGDGVSGHSLTIHNMFFESNANTPIAIPSGQPAPAALAVPVGGAIPLGLLLLAAGAMAVRRRQHAV